MLVKICGITRFEDAEAAIKAGAYAVGFVFWPESPRFVEPLHAREIVARLPRAITPVGVFVNQPLDHVIDVATQARLGVVQLHGDETPDYAERMAFTVVKALPVGPDAAERAEAWPARVTLVLDVQDRVKRGGTGRTVDWQTAGRIASRRRVMLAGGLTPENVARAVAAVRPFGIDVSSGVEHAPGVKDHARLRALFEVLDES